MDVPELVVKHQALSSSLTYLVMIGGAVGLALSGWNYAIQSKIKSIATLWQKFDEHKESYNEQRVVDAKEYASRRELQMLGNRLEEKIDSAETKLEKRIDGLGDKIDQALSELRRRDA